MSDESPKPSEVIPLLVAALVCDVAVADPSTGKTNLIGVFDIITVVTFPTARPISLYLKLTDAEGFYRINIRYVRVSDGMVIAEAGGELKATNRLESIDAVITFPPLPIPEPGRYAFEILANSVYLGSSIINAKQLRITRGGEQ